MRLTIEERVVAHNTFVIERSYPVAAERVFAAFADTGKKRRWYGESAGHSVEEFEMEFRVGGMERSTLRIQKAGPMQGVAFRNEGVYHDIVANQRIVVSSGMQMNGRTFSASLITFEFVADGEGTRLVMTHQGAFFEGSDGAAGRERGWRELLDYLGQELAR